MNCVPSDQSESPLERTLMASYPRARKGLEKGVGGHVPPMRGSRSEPNRIVNDSQRRVPWDDVHVRGGDLDTVRRFDDAQRGSLAKNVRQ
jgi:hypothetical protein